MTAVQLPADWALRSSLLILGGALLLWALRVKDPSVRLAAWTALLFGSLAIPALTATLPAVPVAVMRAAPPALEASAMVPEAGPSALPAVSRRVDTGTAPRGPFDWRRAALLLYLLVAAALLLRSVAGLALSQRLLRRSRATGLTTEGIEIRESARVDSPLAVGILRPVILLPADWRAWDAVQLEAVLAHERAHIRRRDPAVQWLSSLHRALLWHSPLSWFLHHLLVRVAEEASDDAAIHAIGDRASYAEVLLHFVARASRNAFPQGVPMARYGRPEARIHRILDGTSLSRGITRWTAAAVLALAAPLACLVAAVQASAPQPASKPLTFDAASVKPRSEAAIAPGVRKKEAGAGPRVVDRPSGGPGTADPGRIHYPGVTLEFLLTTAYGVNNFQISGPNWLASERFDVDATMPPDTTPEQFRLMLQSLLRERFHLAAHRETKEFPGYAIVLAKGGPKFKESVSAPAPPDDSEPALILGPDGYFVPPPRPGVFFQVAGGSGRSTFRQATMEELATHLQNRLKHPVTDATGLHAKYDFELTYSLEGLSWGSERIPVSRGDGEGQPDIFAALQSQLGLKLESKAGLLETIVIDHIEKAPTEN